MAGETMHVLTDAEVHKFLATNEWNHGIKVDGTHLYYASPEANCIELKFPETPLRATYFARVAAMMGIEDEGFFYGALLWITLSTIGSHQLEKAGWKIVEKMRQGFGENRPLQTASGQWFRSDELVDFTAFILQCFVFGWDAYLVFSGSKDFFIFISHDEYWGIVTRTEEVHKRLLSQLNELGAFESPNMRGRFCRPPDAL
jgi:hypothetical protein